MFLPPSICFHLGESSPPKRLLNSFIVHLTGLVGPVSWIICAMKHAEPERKGIEMSRKILLAVGLMSCALAGCRGPQTTVSPAIVSSSPISACPVPVTPGCSSCAGGGGAGGAIVSPYGPPPTVGTGPAYVAPPGM
ncbi:hypothetical protein BH10PLA2_BH10PLA2_32420 [soil metagenome]